MHQSSLSCGLNQSDNIGVFSILLNQTIIVYSAAMPTPDLTIQPAAGDAAWFNYWGVQNVIMSGR